MIVLSEAVKSKAEEQVRDLEEQLAEAQARQGSSQAVAEQLDSFKWQLKQAHKLHAECKGDLESVRAELCRTLEQRDSLQDSSSELSVKLARTEQAMKQVSNALEESTAALKQERERCRELQQLLDDQHDHLTCKVAEAVDTAAAVRKVAEAQKQQLAKLQHECEVAKARADQADARAAQAKQASEAAMSSGKERDELLRDFTEQVSCLLCAQFVGATKLLVMHTIRSPWHHQSPLRDLHCAVKGPSSIVLHGAVPCRSRSWTSRWAHSSKESLTSSSRRRRTSQLTQQQ